jgi:dTDP-4-amino-4,6-dideoxygalactose transaminase
MRPQLPRLEEVSVLLRKMDSSQIYSNMGPLSEEFKDRLSDYLNLPREKLCLLTNATLAIQGLIEILDPADWVVPDWTFVATGLATIGSRKNLILADVRDDDWELNDLFWSDSENKLKFGFVPVAPFGRSPNIEKWKDFKYVIHDAAASFGSPPPNINNLNSTSAIVYSLHATKVLPAGEGSVVVCGSEEMAATLQSWSNFGFNGNRESLIIGTNAKMSEIVCAYGLTSLRLREKEFQDWNIALTSAAAASKGKIWQSFISNLPGIRPYWIAKFSSESMRNKAISELELAGIQSRKWWPSPLSRMKAFNDFSPKTSNLISQNLSDTTLGLPMFRELSEDQIQQIVSVIDAAIESE